MVFADHFTHVHKGKRHEPSILTLQVHITFSSFLTTFEGLAFVSLCPSWDSESLAVSFSSMTDFWLSYFSVSISFLLPPHIQLMFDVIQVGLNSMSKAKFTALEAKSNIYQLSGQLCKVYSSRLLFVMLPHCLKGTSFLIVSSDGNERTSSPFLNTSHSQLTEWNGARGKLHRCINPSAHSCWALSGLLPVWLTLWLHEVIKDPASFFLLHSMLFISTWSFGWNSSRKGTYYCVCF